MGLKKILTFFTFLFPLVLMGQTESVCDSFAYEPSTPAQREALLNRTKAQLIDQAGDAMSSIENVVEDFSSCSDEGCAQFKESFLNSIREQFQMAKLTRALAERPRAMQGGIRSPRTVGELLVWIQNDYIHAQHVARTNIRGFHFSEQEERKIVRLWVHVFVKTALALPEERLPVIIEKVRAYFQSVSENLNYMNPLLAFLDEEDTESFEGILPAFDRLIQFNEDFIQTIQGLQTRHRRGFWSYPNLTLRDHEMGLVNFPDQIEEIIQVENDSTMKRSFCNAWSDLKNQQTRRVRSSIGVGFATSVICGVGIWSGLGTLPALLVCAPALADGMWGARRGFLDSRLAAQSLQAGRQIFGDQSFSEGILTRAQSHSQQRRANIVFLINMAGLVPVGKSLAFTHAGSRGRPHDLFTLPASDVSVSITETSAANIVYLTMAYRGVEALTFEFQEELDQLIELFGRT